MLFRKWKKDKVMTHASLFSGIGGPEVAAAMLGWENVFHCEINEFGRKVLEYWFPNSESYEDITKTDFRKFRGTIDVLTGGFPCQPFSYAGKRGGAARPALSLAGNAQSY
jgi:DNA (cytosine-5)-methyltransferase 1